MAAASWRGGTDGGDGCRRCPVCGSVQAPLLDACIDCGAGRSDARAPAGGGPALWRAVAFASGVVLLLFVLARWL